MIKNLNQKLKFIELMDEMKNIERAMYLKNGKQETNAEDSFHLAMMVITFAEDFPKLNIRKCLELALIHDIVEIYAWDTIFMVDKKEKINSKKQREKDAFLRLEKEFSESFFDNIKCTILEYEEKITIESKFVHSLDKIQPIIQVIIEWWKTWHNWKYDKNKFLEKYEDIFKEDEFWFRIIVDKYFEKAEKENMFYVESKIEIKEEKIF